MTSPFPDVTHAPVRRPGDVGKTGVFFRPGLNQPGMTTVTGAAGGGNVSINISGALLEGLAPTLIDRMLAEIKYLVAAQILADWQQNMDRAFRNPTPYYETQVMVQQVREDQVVHDRGLIYGNWLEGTSSRNRTTSFKGYGALKRAVDSTVRKAPQIIGPVVGRFIRGVG